MSGGCGRHAAAVPIAETDLLAMWLAQQAGLQPPDGALSIASADGEISGERISGTAANVPWAREAAAVVLAAQTGGAVYVAIVDVNDGFEGGHNLAGEPRDRLRSICPRHALAR